MFNLHPARLKVLFKSLCAATVQKWGKYLQRPKKKIPKYIPVNISQSQLGNDMSSTSTPDIHQHLMGLSPSPPPVLWHPLGAPRNQRVSQHSWHDFCTLICLNYPKMDRRWAWSNRLYNSVILKSTVAENVRTKTSSNRCVKMSLQMMILWALMKCKFIDSGPTNWMTQTG